MTCVFYRWFGIIGPTTFKRLCEEAGIEGYNPNHSLRVTTATRLFQSGAEEQLIMVRTSHRSTHGVSAYKRSCPEQAEQLSKALNREQVPTNSERACANHMGTPRQSLAYETTVELL